MGSFFNFLISIKASCVKMHKIINMRTGFKPSKVGPMNPQEKSTQNQIDLFVEKRSSVGLQQLEASLASFSANSKDLSKKITADLLRMIKKLTSELQLKFKNDQQGDLWKPALKEKADLWASHCEKCQSRLNKMNDTLKELEAENMNQRREINEMQQYKASNRAEKMIIQMGKDLIKGSKEVKKEIVKVEKEMNKIPSKFRKILKRKDEDEYH